jgi:hypothetical protein
MTQACKSVEVKGCDGVEIYGTLLSTVKQV